MISKPKDIYTTKFLDEKEKMYEADFPELASKRHDILKKVVTTDTKWLDVGCGRAPAFDGWQCNIKVGIDPIAEHVNHCKKAFRTAEFVTTPIEIYRTQQKFDIVTCLEHAYALADPTDFCNGLMKHLNPGASVYIEVAHPRKLGGVQEGPYWNIGGEPSQYYGAFPDIHWFRIFFDPFFSKGDCVRTPSHDLFLMTGFNQEVEVDPNRPVRSRAAGRKGNVTPEMAKFLEKEAQQRMERIRRKTRSRRRSQVGKR
jgi:hypothetical protein